MSCSSSWIAIWPNPAASSIDVARSRLVARQFALFRPHVELLLDVAGEPAEVS